MSILRKTFKDASTNAVVGSYGLGDGCEERVFRLLEKSAYIYILNAKVCLVGLFVLFCGSVP